MKELAISKIKSVGKVGYILSIIAEVLLIVGIVACIAGAVILAVLPDDLVSVKMGGNAEVTVNAGALGQTLPEDLNTDELLESGKMDVDFDVNGAKYEARSATKDGDKLIIDAAVGDIDFSLGSLMWVIIAAIVPIVSALVVVIFVGGLCKAFRDCETPFEENVIRKMNNIGLALIPLTVITSIWGSIVSGIMSGKFSISFSLDLAVVIAILLIFALAYIFKYGAMLQKESDETL